MLSSNRNAWIACECRLKVEVTQGKLGHMNLSSTSRLLLLVCMSVWSVAGAGQLPAYASEDIRLHLSYLPHRLTEDASRQYGLLVEELLAGANVSVDRKLAPLKRTTALFKADPGSCVFPANVVALDMGDKASEVVALETVDVVSVRLYTTQQNRVGARLEDFAPERVGYIRGSGALHLLGPNAESFLPINSEKQLISMLELGRLDAFLGHHPDTALAMDDLGKSGVLHVNPLPFESLEFPVSFVCHVNDVGERFIKAINPRISAMRHSGRLRQILGPHAEVPSSDLPEEDGPLIK